MTAATPKKSDRVRFPGVRAPKPLLSPETEQQLSARQVELLDELEERVAKGGLAALTMAEIARTVKDREAVLLETIAFTDARGRFAPLARRRAEAVERALEAQGIERWRVSVRVERDETRSAGEAWRSQRVQIVPLE